jgi:hypothetical protein
MLLVPVISRLTADKENKNVTPKGEKL